MKKNYLAISILFICGLFLFYKYISQLFPSLIGHQLMEEFALTGIQIGILASSYYYSYSIMQLLAGVMLDRYPLRWLSSFAVMLTTLALIGFVHTNNFWLMCGYRALMGVGCSFATSLYLKCAAVFTSERTFGFVSSLLATATMIGAAVGSWPIARLFESVGWYEGLMNIGFAGCILSIICVLFVKTKTSALSNQPVRMNSIKKVVLNPANIWLLIYSGLTFSPVIVMGGLWGVPFLELKLQISSGAAASLISIMFLGHAIGSPVWALLNAQLNNRKNLMFFSNLSSMICLSAIIFVPMGFAITMVLFFLFGFSVGCFMLSFEICRKINGIALMGFAVSFINTGEGLVGIVLEPWIGFVLDILKEEGVNGFSLANYQTALSILLICYGVSSLCIGRLFKLNRDLTGSSFAESSVVSTNKHK